MDWPTYKGRFIFYLQANSITDAALKKATLLTLIGDSAYCMVADLHLSVDLSSVNFDILIVDLDADYGKKNLNWHYAYNSCLSFSTKVNQSTSISRTSVIN